MNPDTQATLPWRVHSTPFDRPVTLHVRNVTLRQLRQQQAWQRSFRDRIDREDIETVINESIARGIAGWDEPTPYSVDALADVFSFEDVVRIAVGWTDALKPDEDTQGKSTSPQASPPVESVASA